MDADENLVRLLDRLLTDAGISNRAVRDSRQTVQELRSFAPDVIVLDLDLPVMDGFEVMQRLRTVIRPSDFVPVLALSADASVARKERAFAVGADDFLGKPIDPTELLLRLRNLLKSRFRHIAMRDQVEALERQLERKGEVRAQQGRQSRKRLDRIRAVLGDGSLQMHYQPIVSLRGRGVVGAEALARFSAKPVRSPHRWFAEAAEVGLGAELEVAALKVALQGLDQLPEGSYLSVNISAHAVRTALAQEELAQVPRGRVVLELTEHTAASEDAELTEALATVRSGGVRLAVDDAGDGFLALRHVLRLQPDIIKIGLPLTRGIDGDGAQRALAAALVHGAGQVGASVVAEGVETEPELKVLRELGVDAAQGYLLGRPQPLPWGMQTETSRHPIG